VCSSDLREFQGVELMKNILVSSMLGLASVVSFKEWN